MRNILLLVVAMMSSLAANAAPCPIQEFGDVTGSPSPRDVFLKYEASFRAEVEITGGFQTVCYRPERRPYTLEEFRNGFVRETRDQHEPCIEIHFDGRTSRKYDRLVEACGKVMILDGVIFSLAYYGGGVTQ